MEQLEQLITMLGQRVEPSYLPSLVAQGYAGLTLKHEQAYAGPTSIRYWM